MASKTMNTAICLEMVLLAGHAPDMVPPADLSRDRGLQVDSEVPFTHEFLEFISNDPLNLRKKGWPVAYAA